MKKYYEPMHQAPDTNGDRLIQEVSNIPEEDGSSGLEGLPEQLMELDTESVDLWHKLDAMTEPELIQFAFDAEGVSTERKMALQRLKAAGIEKTRVKLRADWRQSEKRL